MKLHNWLFCMATLPLLQAAPASAAENASKVQPFSHLVSVVRHATAQYRNVRNAESDGYGPFLGCVSGPDVGAMGVHYVNGDFLEDGELDPRHPEALIYEPQPDGRLRLVGVEYITFAEGWDATHEAAPVLEGQVLNYTGEPNRYRIPAHYELHVWAWRNNPLGTFSNWNSRVSCATFQPPATE